MAKPLTAENADGYIHDLLQSLTEEEPASDRTTANEPADHIARMIAEIESEIDDWACGDRSETVEPTGVGNLEFEPSSLVEQIADESDAWDDEEIQLSDSAATQFDGFVQDSENETADEQDNAQDNPDDLATHADDLDSNAETTNASDAWQEVELPNADDTRDTSATPPKKKRKEQADKLLLTPRPTGNAYTIAQLREVANLTVADALNSYRRKQLIRNAYSTFAVTLFFTMTALLAALFGVQTAGFSRNTALVSIMISVISALVYFFITFSLCKNAATSQLGSPSVPSGESIANADENEAGIVELADGS